MKSLYESILSSTKAGKTAMVEKWCEENNPFNGHWKVNTKGEIECTQRGNDLKLYFDTYEALPDYIQFADDEELKVIIGKGNSMHRENITSLRGIPNKCRWLSISVHAFTLPSFEANPRNFYLSACNLKSTGKIKITLNVKTDDDGEFRLKDAPYEREAFADALPNMEVKGAITYDCVNCAYLGDTFSKLLNRKAPMNKYKGHYETPINNEALPLIETYFGNKFDMKSLKEISYTQNSRLVKHDGMWYRCKNWL